MDLLYTDSLQGPSLQGSSLQGPSLQGPPLQGPSSHEMAYSQATVKRATLYIYCTSYLCYTSYVYYTSYLFYTSSLYYTSYLYYGSLGASFSSVSKLALLNVISGGARFVFYGFVDFSFERDLWGVLLSCRFNSGETTRISLFLPPQWLPKTSQNRPKRLPREAFFRLRFRLRFWNDFGPILAPQTPPFGHPFRSQNRSKKRSKIHLQKRWPQERPKTPPRGSQDAPGRPRDPPRRPQEAPRTPQEDPRSSPRGPREPPREPKSPPGSPQDLCAQPSSKKFEIVENKSKKRVDNGHPPWSLATVAQKPKALSKRSNPRGWRRWSREALVQ